MILSERLSRKHTSNEIIQRLEKTLPINFSIDVPRPSTKYEDQCLLFKAWQECSSDEWDTIVSELVVPQVKFSLSFITLRKRFECYYKVKQDTEEWLNARKPTLVFAFFNPFDEKDDQLHFIFWKMSRASASICSDMAGYNNWMPFDKLIEKLIHPEDLSNNENIIHGKLHEPDARDQYERRVLKILHPCVRIFVGGLYIKPGDEWAATSDDGTGYKFTELGLKYVKQTDTLETLIDLWWEGVIPDKELELCVEFELAMEAKCPGAGKIEKLYALIPLAYEWQQQMIMKVRSLPFIDFDVWNPWSCYIQRRYFESQKAEQLMNDMRQFWFGPYLKASLLDAIGAY